MKRDETILPLDVSRWTIRFVLLGGAVAWLLHLVFSYVIAEFGVLSGLVNVRWGGFDAVSWLLLFLSGTMFTLAAAAIVVSLRHRTRFSRALAAQDENLRTVQFCARFGVETNLVFLVIIAVQTIPIFYFVRT